MKKLAIILALVVTPAFAQPAPQQSFDDLQVQYLTETGQLRQLLGQSQAALLQLRKENAELKAKAEQKPEPKK